MVKGFLASESAPGLLLMASAVLAIICANTFLHSYYDLLLSTPVAVQVADLVIAKPLLLWINDGLMAVFFFLVGLELKRELLEGELADKRNILLPAVGAVGGMAAPAGVYLALNWGNEVAMSGWAVPAATDIAFALGVLSLLGSRVPLALKVFLTSLAIFDDIGAIVIIALFYTSKISALALIVAAICLVMLWIINRAGVYSKIAYFALGTVMWVALLKSGVHATLSGVLLALFIPIKPHPETGESPLRKLEHELHTWVSFLVLPVFAFANAGISFSGMTWEQVSHGVPVGIALGLFFGKQIGIFGLCWLFIQLRILSLPKNVSWLSLYGIATLCGIGFTMSLFIGSLAFEETGNNLLFDERLGILVGSLASGVLGYFLLNASLPKEAEAPTPNSKTHRAH